MTFEKMEKGSIFATRPVSQMSITFFLLEVGSSMIPLLKLLHGSIIPIIYNYNKAQHKKVTFFGKFDRE